MPKALECDGLDDLSRPFPEVLPQVFIDSGNGRLLDDLLVAPLDGALAVAEDSDVPICIGQDLNFQVSRRCDVVLNVDLITAECRACLAAHAGKVLSQLIIGEGHLHPPAASAVQRLEDHGKAEVLGQEDSLADVGNHPIGARDGGYVQRPGNLLCPGLVADGPKGGTRRPDELDSVLLAEKGELGVLREETVTGVDGVGLPCQGRRDDGIDIEVALRGLLGADLYRLVGEVQVLHVLIGLGIDHDGFQPQLTGRPDDAQDHLAPVGYENPLHN